jgi:archaellum biogenesis ATPase FlaH
MFDKALSREVSTLDTIAAFKCEADRAMREGFLHVTARQDNVVNWIKDNRNLEAQNNLVMILTSDNAFRNHIEAAIKDWNDTHDV